MDEELYEMHIPANAIKSGRFLNIKWTHWVEAFIALLAVIGIVMNINFVLRIKMILISVIGISVFVLLLRGIKGRTLTQFFVNAVKIIGSERYNLSKIFIFQESLSAFPSLRILQHFSDNSASLPNVIRYEIAKDIFSFSQSNPHLSIS